MSYVDVEMEIHPEIFIVDNKSQAWFCRPILFLYVLVLAGSLPVTFRICE